MTPFPATRGETGTPGAIETAVLPHDTIPPPDLVALNGEDGETFPAPVSGCTYPLVPDFHATRILFTDDGRGGPAPGFPPDASVRKTPARRLTGAG